MPKRIFINFGNRSLIQIGQERVLCALLDYGLAVLSIDETNFCKSKSKSAVVFDVIFLEQLILSDLSKIVLHD